MAATGTPTPNIGLRIPQGTDPASVDDINYNSNLLDTKLGAVGNDSVQDQIDSLNSKLTKSSGTMTMATGVTNTDLSCNKNGEIVCLNGCVAISTPIAGNNGDVLTLPSGFRPPENTDIYAYMKYGNTWQMAKLKIYSNGDVKTNIGGSTVTENIFFNCAFAT